MSLPLGSFKSPRAGVRRALCRSPFLPFPTLLPFSVHILCMIAKRPVSQSSLIGKTIGIMPLVLLSL